MVDLQDLKSQTSNLKHQTSSLKHHVTNIESQIPKPHFLALRVRAAQPGPGLELASGEGRGFFEFSNTG